MVKNKKTWISWEQNITFIQNKKILNLFVRWHILRSYCFVGEVIFNFAFVANVASFVFKSGFITRLEILDLTTNPFFLIFASSISPKNLL